MLVRHAGAETDALNHFQQQLADWAPRLFYAMVAAWMALQLLSAPAPMPLVPV
jgi:hypothetical protein